MKWRYQKFIRIIFYTAVTLVLISLLSMSVTAAYYTEQTTFRNVAIACSVALLVLTGVAIQEAENQIRKKGYTKSIEAFSRDVPLIGTLKMLAKGHKEPVDKVVPQDYVYVRRHDGSVGEVYLHELYLVLLRDKCQPGSVILKQSEWVTLLGRQYLDDIRQVLVDAKVVRRKGNGAIVALHTSGYMIELVKRHYFG